MDNVLGYEIKEKYSHEISDIIDKLNQIKERRIYGLEGGAPTDGSLTKNIDDLEKMFFGLLAKIQTGKDGKDEEIAKQLFGM